MSFTIGMFCLFGLFLGFILVGITFAVDGVIENMPKLDRKFGWMAYTAAVVSLFFLLFVFIGFLVLSESRARIPGLNEKIDFTTKGMINHQKIVDAAIAADPQLYTLQLEGTVYDHSRLQLIYSTDMVQSYKRNRGIYQHRVDTLEDSFIIEYID